MKIKEEIISLVDPKFKEFNRKIVKSENEMLGITCPNAKMIAKKYANTNDGNIFLDELPHKYYDENMVHGYMLGFLKCDGELLRCRIEHFLPYIDNWAVCDTMTSGLKNFFKNPDNVYGFIKSCLKSDMTYKVRFGVVALLDYYIKDKYIDEVLLMTSEIKSDEYYIKMAQAWLYSIALVKFYDKTVEFIKSDKIEKWVRNKALQKARESYRINKEQKDYLNTLKIK